MRREILRHLWLRGRPPTEGSTSTEELLYLSNLVERTGARLIGEIGFNAGFSSFAFLSSNPDTHVVSFDLGEHAYSRTAKKLIDKKFPGRHTLIYPGITNTPISVRRGTAVEEFDLHSGERP